MTTFHPHPAAIVEPQPADPETPCGCHPDFHEVGCHQPPAQPDA